MSQAHVWTDIEAMHNLVDQDQASYMVCMIDFAGRSSSARRHGCDSISRLHISTIHAMRLQCDVSTSQYMQIQAVTHSAYQTLEALTLWPA